MKEQLARGSDPFTIGAAEQLREPLSPDGAL